MHTLSLLVLFLGLPWRQLPGVAHDAQFTEPPTELERAILDRALDCNRARRKPDPLLLLDLLRTEERAGVPTPLRGMVLAAACSESGFDPNARGDFRFGQPRAIGVLQQWPWFEHAYKFDRRDPLAAAEAWLVHIQSHLEPTRKRCGATLRGEQLWVKAWVHAVRAPSRTGRCHQTPKHYLRLLQWRPSWRRLLPRPGTDAVAASAVR